MTCTAPRWRIKWSCSLRTRSEWEGGGCECCVYTPLPLFLTPTLHPTRSTFWDPSFSDVKLWQTHCLIKEVERLVTSWNAAASSASPPKRQSSLPVILCGDFNSEPGSSVHKMLFNNWLAYAAGGGGGGGAPVRRVELSGADLPHDPFNILGSRGRLGHGLLLASAYAAVRGAEPAFTNYTRSYRGTLDYVVVSADRVRPVAALTVPHPSRLVPASGLCGDVAPDGPDGGGGGGGAAPSAPFLPSPVGGGVGTGGPISSRASGLLVSTDSSEGAKAAMLPDVTDEDGELVALPNAHNPSDHIPLVFDLVLGQAVVPLGGGKPRGPPAPPPTTAASSSAALSALQTMLSSPGGLASLQGLFASGAVSSASLSQLLGGGDLGSQDVLAALAEALKSGGGGDAQLAALQQALRGGGGFPPQAGGRPVQGRGFNLADVVSQRLGGQ